MKTFQVPENVVCYIEIYKSGALYNPVPSSGNAVTVTIYKVGTVTAVLAETALAPEATGKYSYSWTTTSQTAGEYRARFVATDGTSKSIKDGSFKLEA